VFRACEKDDFARVSPEELNAVACVGDALAPHTIQLLLYIAAKHGHNALVFGDPGYSASQITDRIRAASVLNTIEILD
jgi:hypothetical protein